MSFFESDHSIVKIDGKAILNNLNYLNQITAQDCELMPIIKSDAYGHGILETARLLYKKEIWGFGIYEIDEATILRRAGITSPILMLSGLLGDDVEKILEFDLTLGVVTVDELRNLATIASLHGKRVPVHLKVDTGMSRFGMTPEEIVWIVTNKNRFKNIEFQGIYSHLACADEPENSANSNQLNLFKEILHQVRLLSWHPKYVHIANSAAILHLKESHFNLARPGIAIYGALDIPGTDGSHPALKHAMSFSSKIIHIKSLPKGACISYGHRFQAQHPMNVAIVPVGYDNGYLRRLSNKAHVLINGFRCQVVGNICMKTIMVDVTGIKCKPGDEVILMGEQKGASVTSVELARHASTISYEFLCLLGKLNKRIFE